MSAGRKYDAVVVGSGISGGWAAKELAERGLKTLVLEAGRSIEPREDYTEHVLPYELRFRGRLDPLTRKRQPVQSNQSDGYTARLYVDDIDHPYSHPEEKPFLWLRGRHLGGRSIMWGRHTYRWSDLDFEANDRDGVGIDWPIRYADLEPWYDHVEEFAGISGHPEGLSQLPDGRFLPPMELNCAELALRDGMARTFGRERVLTIGRVAVLTRPHRGRAACHYCGPCERGCVTGSYFSSLSATLPAALSTGNCTIRPYSSVASVLYDDTTGRAQGVRVIDSLTREELEVRAKLVFLCASAFESVRILLNSREPAHPDGLGNSSGLLGRFIMDHALGGGASGRIEGFGEVPYFSQRPNTFYVPRFRNVATKHAGFTRGYGFQGAGSRPGWERGVDMPELGASLKRALREDGPWTVFMVGFGECLPREENSVSIDPELVDHLGIPSLRIDFSFGENEAAMLRDVSATAVEMLEAGGAVGVSGFAERLPPGRAIHEMGGARMGRDPRTSILDAWNEVHDAKNLYVTDGGCMTSSACQNPSLTYMALTARAVDHAVRKLEEEG
jgi:choline dehydrogenase-like flavoprotein